ncbi:MAG: NERD domain-containing protein [Candidatus Bathyarchaeota archaeon]|nr:NERD domain-containing protein [Candidatus Bathyarchaeota archaeon]
MRRVKTARSYVQVQMRKKALNAFLCVLVVVAVVLSVLAKLFLTRTLGVLEQGLLLFCVAPLLGFYYYLGEYRVYRGGLEGEKQVTKRLNSTLSDDYYLLNGVSLKGSRSDIDHIVVGPNGVFVIETKNWSGSISCKGDNWQRQNSHINASPSKQTKANADKIKDILNASTSIRRHGVWVEGILVFTNTNANTKLNLKNPTTPTLQLHQLPNHITNYKNHNPYTQKQQQQIIKQIQKQTQ